jgi:hypothetical protein
MSKDKKTHAKPMAKQHRYRSKVTKIKNLPKPRCRRKTI